jgi:ribonuclease P protein component
MPGWGGGLERRLRRSDFKRATGGGVRLVSRHFLIFIFDRSDAGPTRLGITVTRKVGNAVRRNRIKRLVREWFRLRTYDLGPCDLILIAKRSFPPDLRLLELVEDLDRALQDSIPGGC